MKYPFKRTGRRMAGAIGLTLSASLTQFAVADTQTIDIEGKSYSVDVESTRAFSEGGTAKHFSGTFTDGTNGWIRFSEFADGSRSGLAVIDGEVYEIKNDTDQASGALVAGSLSDGADESTCGVDGGGFNLPDEGGQHSAFLISEQLSSSYSDLCGTLVDGTCILANLEVVYDQNFINTFSDTNTVDSDVISNADALLNMVEGYYSNQFNMKFNLLTSRYITNDDNIIGGGEFITDSTSSGTVLREVTSRKCDEFRGSSNCSDALTVNYVANPSTAAQFDHLEQERALLHFVTGRDFDGTTIGVAWVDAACSTYGIGTGTSQVTYSGGSPSIARTAATVAHEIGHNLDADHDGDTSPGANSSTCPVTGFVMNSQLGVLPTEFSSCSEEVISTKIASQANVTACYLPPVDVVMSADASPAGITEDVAFTQTYSVTASTGFSDPTSATITGTVTDAAINTVTLAGSACTVAGDAASFSCTYTNFGVQQQLAVNVTPQQNANLSVTANVVNAYELSTADNTLSTDFTVAEPTPDPDPEPEPDPDPTPQPTPEPPAFGAINLFAALPLLLVFFRRRLH